MDRIDREYMLEQHKEFSAERAADLKAAGPLLQGKKLDDMVRKIEEETRLPRAVVGNIIETINGTAGEDGVDTRTAIKEAFSGHVTNPRFLDRLAGELTKDVKLAIDDREKRIIENKNAPVTPTVSAPAVATPSLGSKR